MLGKVKLVQSHRGVGLIEVLVSLFILAVGLLGVLAMQANGIKGNQKAGFSTDAQILALDMASRIQAYNVISDAADDDDYDNIDIPTNGVPADPGCALAGCSKTQQVTYDVFQWGTALSQKLPGGTGTVKYGDGTDALKYIVTVMWDGNQDGSTGTACNGAANQLTCFSLEFKL